MSRYTGLRIGVPTLLAILLYSAAACANCVLPAAPSRLPDGSAASEQEMAAALRTIKQYNADVDDFNKCIEFEERQNHISRDVYAARHDDAVTTLSNVVSHFNEQVRRFKARKS